MSKIIYLNIKKDIIAATNQQMLESEQVIKIFLKIIFK